MYFKVTLGEQDTIHRGKQVTKVNHWNMGLSVNKWDGKVLSQPGLSTSRNTDVNQGNPAVNKGEKGLLSTSRNKGLLSTSGTRD